MPKNNISPVRSRQVISVLACLVFALVGLWLILTANVALASSQKGAANNLDPLALQTTPTPTATVELQAVLPFSLTLETLGYDAVTLNSPRSANRYGFRIPQSWIIEGDGVLNLDLSYTYSQPTPDSFPTLFGNLTVSLDGDPLTVFAVTQQNLDRYRLTLTLPVEQLADRNQHVIDLAFDAGTVCELPHKAALTIHQTSFIELNYTQRPLDLDLSTYPQPFYSPAFSTDSVRFVLPAKPSASLASEAVAVAAKLGDLTNNRLVINTTTDLELSQVISSTRPITEDFIVIGQPQENQLLSLLNELAELPVALHPRQLELTSQGPATILPDDTFTYIYTITNTLDEPVNLSLLSALPTGVEFVKCTGNCSRPGEDRSVTWNRQSLDPEKTTALALTLKAAATLTGTVIENMVTLSEVDLGPVNADMVTSVIGADSSDEETSVSDVNESDYFFTYNGRAVAPGDGIVQEIVSPWDENQAILIITGLSDEAVKKASQAMSSEARFPGMQGPVALVQDTLPLSAVLTEVVPSIDETFEDLGYIDQVIRGESGGQADYFFDIPPGWELTEDAYLDLYFIHSQLINYEGSGLTILLNRDPVASIPLDEKTAADGYLRVSLADVDIQTARPNRLIVQTSMSLPPSSDCSSSQSDRAWFLVRNNSKIYLPHNENPNLTIDLGNYPYPFNLPQELTNLLLALPDAPTTDEWQLALRLASSLGSAAGGITMSPVATLGDTMPAEELAEYNIIALGRPTRNALIQQINEDLPQPFLPNSDEIEQRLDNVVFRLSPGLNLGYLQLIPSPWNADRAVLALTGTTDEGVQQAFRILTGRALPAGNLVLINGTKVSAINTRILTQGGVAAAVATAVPEMTATVAPKATATPIRATTPVAALVDADTESVAEPQEARSNRPGWLIPLVGVNGLLVIAIIAFAFWKSRQNKA